MIGALRLVPALAAEPLGAGGDGRGAAAEAAAAFAGVGGSFVPLAPPSDTASIGIWVGTGTGTEEVDAPGTVLPLLAFIAWG